MKLLDKTAIQHKSNCSLQFADDRRRGGRNRPTEDNRRHTLGNDMLVYTQQNQNLQQRAMDLEVNVITIFHGSIKTFHEL